MFGVASTQFADDFDSPAFRVISTIICVISVIFWLFLVVYTLPLLISGELLLQNGRHKGEEEEEEEEEGVRDGEGDGGGSSRRTTSDV